MIMFPTRELIFIYSSHLRKYTRHHLSLCDNACRISIIIKLSNYEPITYFHKRVLNARNNLKICVRFPRFLSLTLLFSRILSYQFLFNRGVSTYVVVEGCVFLWKNELSLSSCCCQKKLAFRKISSLLQGCLLLSSSPFAGKPGNLMILCGAAHLLQKVR